MRLGAWPGPQSSAPIRVHAGQGAGQGEPSLCAALRAVLFRRKNMQRNKQVAMGRKKFNMDPKKVSGSGTGLRAARAALQLCHPVHRVPPG